MEALLTVRVPRALAQRLARLARQRGMRRSQLVREAIEQYLAPLAEPGGLSTWDRLTPFVGAVELDAAAVEHDALARRLREHNWRE